MLIKVKCTDCGTIYDRDENSWLIQTGSEITTYTCPNCGSINCRKECDAHETTFP